MTVVQAVVLVFCLVAVVVSGLSVVYTRHVARGLFAELEGLRRERDAQVDRYGQLQLERSTWAAQLRIERLARERLGMARPTPQQQRVLLVPAEGAR
ncbi:MAG: hypothetical protein KatS3mg121_0482 [Gammaproteobacteria bacterium]|nr:MAG: hypothetical protein KatS3mg121_0482 [Gammaproteobacteria bacterium]